MPRDAETTAAPARSCAGEALAALHAGARALAEDEWERIQSPALVVDLDRVRANLRRVIELCGGDAGRWRPHVKTTKLPAVFAELAAAGVTRFKCATTREARCLLGVLREREVEGADVLVAYPLVGPALAALGRLAAEHAGARVAVLCEDPAAVDDVPAGVDVFVDLNCGMDRTGVPLDDAETLARVAERAGERFRGVHAYDGHLHQPDPDERRRAVAACYDRVLERVRGLVERGLPVGEVVTAGTPSFPFARDYRGFAELAGVRHTLSPGTVVYHDLRSLEQNGDLGLVPAALVHARVVSHPAPDVVTADAGSKALAAEAGDPCAVALGRPELIALTPSEEHLPLRVTAGERPARGSALFLFPRHVCPTVNLAEEALLVEGGRVRAVVPVAARAHDLLDGPARGAPFE